MVLPFGALAQPEKHATLSYTYLRPSAAEPWE